MTITVQHAGKKIALALVALCLLTGLALAPSLTTGAEQAQAASVTSIVKAKAKGGSTAGKLKKLATYMEGSTYSYSSLYAINKKTHLTKMSASNVNAYAKYLLKSKKGSCYHYAALYAKLAKKATGCKVRVGVGKTTGFTGNVQYHAWTEVKVNGKWYVYDPLMDKMGSGNYVAKKRASVKGAYQNFKGAKYTTVK